MSVAVWSHRLKMVKDPCAHSAGVLLCFLLPLANSHTYTHMSRHIWNCQSGAVWMTCGSRHNFLPCGKRECCSLLKTLADFSFSHHRRDGNSSTSSLPCTLYAHSSALLLFFFFLLPLESEPPSEAPVVWPKHPLFIYSSLSVEAHCQCFFPPSEVITLTSTFLLGIIMFL